MNNKKKRNKSIKKLLKKNPKEFAEIEQIKETLIAAKRMLENVKELMEAEMKKNEELPEKKLIISFR